MTEYEHVLRGGVGLYQGSTSVSRENFRNYISALNLESYYPGIQGVGFSIYLKPREISDHIKKVRAEGFKNYSISPEGSRKIYTSIVFLEPFIGRNLRAFGYDMFSEPVRQEAMERARDTGAPAASGFLKLVQETETDIQNGFLIYMPVYRKDASINTIEERRQNLVGFVYAPFRINDLMNGILSNRLGDLGFEISENLGSSVNQRQVYISTSVRPDYKFEESVNLMVAGQKWKIRFYSLPGFISRIDSLQPTIILAFGLVINLLILVIMISFHDRKRSVEKDVAKLTAELNEKNERIELALDASQDGVWDWEIKSNRVFLSKRWKNMLGYEEFEIENKFQSWVNLIHPEDRPHALLTIQDFVDGRINEYSLEHRLKAANGSYLWISSKAVGLRDIYGKAYRVAGSHKDITERRIAEMSLRDAKDEALSSAQLKSEFLANMSHEIRTPLNGVVGMAELLRMTSLSELQEEYVEVLLHSSEHLKSLVDDILSLSKIESGHLDLNSSDIFLKEILANIYRDFRLAAEKKGITFEVHSMSDSDVAFCGDIVRINQILFNLVSNAIKFTEVGTVALRTSCVERENNEYLIRFEVEDTGIGIKEAALQDIFDPFVQGDNSTTRKYGGTGLGLSICKKLVTLMNGTIEVKSTFGKGSTFTFNIPVKRVDLQPELKAPVTEKIPYNAGRKLKILIAEDHPINQKVLSRLFDIYDHEADIVSGGLEVLKLLSERTYDLILMDCHMPELDGFSTARKIRQIKGPISQIPIIALTADIFTSTRSKCFESGMNSIITKPIDFRALFIEIEKWTQTKDIVDQSAQDSVAVKSQVEPDLLLEKFLDIDALKRLRSLNIPGHKDFAEELVTDFLQKAPTKLLAIETAMRERQGLVILDLAHSLKSAAATIGALSIGSYAEKIENLARLDSLDEARLEFNSLVEAINLLSHQLAYLSRNETESDRVKNS